MNSDNCAGMMSAPIMASEKNPRPEMAVGAADGWAGLPHGIKNFSKDVAVMAPSFKAPANRGGWVLIYDQFEGASLFLFF